MNTKLTKLNKNYVVLATLIAALGVIFSLFFAINSFAEEQIQDSNAVSHTVTGKIIDPNGDGVEGAQVNIYSPGTFFTGPTDSNGDFSIVISGETDPIRITSWVAIKVGDDTRASLSFEGGEAASISSDQNLGTKTAFYTSGLVPEINGQIHDSDSYGSWNIPDSPATFNSGTPAVYYKTATAHTDGANLVVDYVDEVGVSKTWTWTFNPASGYEVQEVKIIKGNPWNSNATSYNLVESSFWQINAVTKPTTETIKISGTVKDLNNENVSGAEVTLVSATGQPTETTGYDGKFEFNVDVSTGALSEVWLNIFKTGVPGSSPSLNGSFHNHTATSESIDVGEITVYYYCMVYNNINSEFVSINEYGSWNVTNSEINGGGLPVLFKTGTATIDGNVVTISYTDSTDQQITRTMKFNTNIGYTFEKINFEGRAPGPTPGNYDNVSIDLKDSSLWTADAIVKPGSSTDCTFTGKVIDGYGNGLGGLDVMITLSCTGGPSPWITGTTDADGTFSITYSIDDTKTYKLYMLSASKMQAENELGINGYQILDIPFTIGDYDFEDLTVEYYGSFIPYINNQETSWNVDKSWFENAYGHWAWASNANNGTPFDFTFSKTGEYVISGNTITATFLQGPGGSTTTVMTYTFVPNYPYVSSGVNVTPLISSDENGTSINSNMRFDGNVEMAKHTVHYSGTIDKVTANGAEIAKDSDVEVTHGAVIIVFPTYTDDKVTKVTINGNYAYSTVADKDLNIIGFQEDAVTISGRVTSDAVSQNGRGSLNLASLFVDTAYAAEVGVADALVQFTQEDGWSTGDMTDAEGYFDLDVVKGAAGVLTISKEGYNTYTKEFTAEELSEDVEVAPVLTVAAQPENVNGSAQTGDNMPYGIVLAVLAVSAFAVYRTARRPKGAHVK